MNREIRQRIAHSTLEALQRGSYENPAGQPVALQECQQAAKAGSHLYRPEDGADLLREFEKPAGELAEVRVYQATTLEAAADLTRQFKRVGCLNFASARNPGGGFLGGSQAQEESLARSSGLYPCLTQFEEMYRYNSLPGSTGLYSDYLVYSPQVPVFRGEAGEWLPQPFRLDVLTAPAVNAGALRRNSPGLLPQLEPVMRHRLRLVLAAAARHGIEALVLGAWGCGVFGNDPAQVAQLFAEALAEPAIRGRFRRLDFAIFDPKPPQAVLAAFQQALAGLTVENW
ncbi:TIGR02452 family protein [Hymenobacter sp. HSC-4F20]|uniref:TIGR02452 family protein n=1 Tax=Hymenobacter sp. HSC-4F20 TaxID=2864135 RepID=UPI001C733FC0|nr:TIGR02452 family protein [Hymenobacter sp. HSC-4F20]MBX0289124.1 TIGR02452 family protein [Hymenobacter sp. HSC-4F20]